MTNPTSTLLLLALALPASATPWHAFGARSMGMGGAGVALPQAGLSSYWNPGAAGLSDNAWGAQAPVSAHAAVTGTTIRGANDLNAVTNDCQASPPGPLCTKANVNAALADFGAAGNGALGDAGAGVNVKVRGLTFFADDFVYIGATPHADTVNTSPAAGPTFIGNNQSRLNLRGISVAEFGAGYALELPFARGLYVGGNAKLLSGKVGYYDYFIANNSAGNSGSLSKFTRGAKQSVQPGFDAGLLWDIGRTIEIVPMHPRIGVTARDVNNPKFSQPDQAKAAGEPNRYSLQGQARAGVAISPFKFWNIIADVDLTHNMTPLDGAPSQILALGTEINVFNRTWLNIPLRAGVSRNIALASSKTSVSVGGGFNFLHVNVDVAATASPQTQQIQSQGKSAKVPSDVGFAGQLGVLFGGSK